MAVLDEKNDSMPQRTCCQERINERVSIYKRVN